MSEAQPRQQFDRELRRLLGAARRRVVVHGGLSVAAAAGLLGAVAVWSLGGEEFPPRAARWGVPLCAAWLLLAVIWARLVRPLRRLRDRATLCRALEASGGLDNLLVAAEEAARRPERWDVAAGVPMLLRERLFSGAAARAVGLRLGRRLPLPGIWLAVLGCAAAAGLLWWGTATAPRRLATGGARLLAPLGRSSPPPGAGLYLADGPLEAVAGTDVTIAARDFGRARAPVDCEVRAGSGLWRAAPCTGPRAAAGAPFALWTTIVPAVRESFAYRFGREGVFTREGTVMVVHPPLLGVWGGTVRPPAYTRLPDQIVPQLPAHLQVPAGTRLVWLGLAAGGVARAAVVSAAGDTMPLVVRGDTLRGEQVVRGPLVYTVRLRDARGLENAPRVTYAVEAVPDAPPVVTLTRPGDDGRLPGEGRVALAVGAGDDYGLARLDLLLRRERAGETPVDEEGAWCRVSCWPPMSPAPGGPAPGALGLITPWGNAAVTPGTAAGPVPAGPLALELTLETGGLELMSGDVLAVCVEALDNREPGPPGRARSAVLRLALPSAAEMLADQVDEGQQRVASLEQLRKRGDEATADLDKLEREWRQDPRPDWERRQKLQAALARQRAVQEELRRTAQALQDDLSRQEQANLNSVELLEKMREVAELLQQVHSEELDRLLAQLREQAASLSPEQVREAMAEIARNQEEFKERLARAIGLLKELAREQEMEGLTSVVARLLREQQALLDAGRADSSATRSPADRSAADERAQRQQALGEEARRLEERVRDALERLAQEQGADGGPSADAMRQALERARERLAQARPDQAMQQAARGLSTTPPPASAQQQQELAQRELAALYHILLQGQLQMQGAMQQYAATNLRRIAAELLALSAREEEIAGLVPGELSGIAVGDLARRQNRVLKATRAVSERLREVGNHSPLLSMRLQRDLDAVVGRLGASVRGLEQGFGATARRETRESVGQLNRIVIGLLTASQMVSAGGSGQGSPLPSEQLQRLAQEQAGLNGYAQELQRQMQQRGLSQELRSRLQRLQSDQSGLAGRLEDLAQEQRDRPAGDRVLGDLEQLTRDMERVADDLGAGRVDDETLARQERILSRLLDAHNSVRKRDFDQRRESRSARLPFASQPDRGAVPVEPRETDAFRRRREPLEKAPADYRDLVRRYFRALDRLLAPAPAGPGGAGGGAP